MGQVHFEQYPERHRLQVVGSLRQGVVQVQGLRQGLQFGAGLKHLGVWGRIVREAEKEGFNY